MAISFTGTTVHTKTLISPSTGTADKVYGADYVSASSHTTTITMGGATATRIPYVDTGGVTLTDSANLSYSEASGPRLQVGSGTTTNAGLILGYYGASGYGAIWSTVNTPSTSNHILAANNTGVYLNGGGGAGLVFQINNTNKADFTSTAGRGLAITAGTATTDVQALSATQTWNASGVTFTGWKFTITDTASASGSLAMQILGGASGATNLLSVRKDGNTTISGTQLQLDATGAANVGRSYWNNTTGWVLGSGIPYAWANNTDAASGGIDASIGRAAANSIVFGGATASGGAVTSRACINKAVTAIADNTATTVFTVTVPNAAHSASIRVRLTGSAGAGGAVGANEATQDAEYMVNVTRTAGVNAVATIGAVVGQAASATVAGGNGVAVTGTLGAITGAVGASNTFTIQVTIARAAGTATNHTCLAFAELLNANATGVTIA